MNPTTEKLWCIHIPGPDDLHAAPSHAIAERMAERHNKDMQEFFDKNPEKLSQWAVTADQCKAQVIEWPHGAEEHAEELADFDAEEWSSAQLQAPELREPDAASLRQDELRAEWHEEMRRDAFGA